MVVVVAAAVAEAVASKRFLTPTDSFGFQVAIREGIDAEGGRLKCLPSSEGFFVQLLATHPVFHFSCFQPGRYTLRERLASLANPIILKRWCRARTA